MDLFSLDAFDFLTELRLETSESRNSDVTETPISNDERTHLVQKSQIHHSTMTFGSNDKNLIIELPPQ